MYVRVMPVLVANGILSLCTTNEWVRKGKSFQQLLHYRSSGEAETEHVQLGKQVMPSDLSNFVTSLNWEF